MKVEQRHREAAAEYIALMQYPGSVYNDRNPDAVKAGSHDSLHIVQAFASFEASLTKRDDELADARIIALGKIADVYERDNEPHAFDRALDAAYDAGRTAAARLRGAKEEVDEWDGPLSAEEQAMIDAAWEKHKAAGPCDRPPEGWRCTRAYGHDGPCAALRAESQS